MHVSIIPSIILSQNIHDSRRFHILPGTRLYLILLDGGLAWNFYTIFKIIFLKKQNSSSVMLHNAYMPFGKDSQFINIMTMVNQFNEDGSCH
jgi:hypothetical protein